MSKTGFSGRLANQRVHGDHNSRDEFEGVVAKINPYNASATIDKTRVDGNRNYSFSVDQIKAYDFLEQQGIAVTIKIENGSRHPWRKIRPRIIPDPKRYQLVTL